MILTELECSGRFRILRPIADGAIASVYEAELLGAEGFSKRVALKVIQPAAASHPDFLRAFVSETKRSADLMHGNIVQIYQLGEMGGEYFVAMEFIQGPSVRQLIDRHRERGRPVPPTLAAYIVSRVCRALDYAHRFVDPSGRRLDIIHCDVSPGNVLATWDGHIKLADFGIARATFSAGLATQEGAREGKQQYMSPEQCMGDDLSARTDVYSLGVMLFELLALDHLGVVERSAASAEGPTLQPLPEFGHLLHGLDATMEYIVRRALEQDPRRRASAAMLGTDLDRWITTQHTYGSPDRLQSHLSQLFPHDFTSAVWAEHPGGEAGFTALERAVRHNANGRAGLLERWFGQ